MDIIKFGTSGWRGIIARDFTFDNVRLATQGIADYLKQLSSFNPSHAQPSYWAMIHGFWVASFHWPPPRCSPPTD